VLREAERRAAQLGHENAGFLSWSSGFIPKAPPLADLGPDFAAWDQLAAELPELYRSLELRRRVEALPLLDASAASLDDQRVLRACALLAILAQAYWYVELAPPERLPDVIDKPWSELRRRLGRPQAVLSYIDLIVYNWRVINPALPDPMRVENMRLLLPTVGNREEQVFYLTQVEILARASPMVRLATLAQDAVQQEDQEALEEALLGIIAFLTKIVRVSLPKINPNPFGITHVDPVVWAKTVAPFAVPMHAGDQGPSGTSSPIFNALDLFFGRKHYGSFLGREIRQLRAAYPPAWQAFLEAISQVSVADYIERTGSKTLRGSWREAFELYAGPNGFLGRHRMKVYGYLELAFKVGRSVTIGGFGGVFKDRTWDQVDNELEAAQGERLQGFPLACREAQVQSAGLRDDAERGGMRHLTLDVSQAGIRYRVGDRCAIFPENSQELIERTLRALGARGDELVALTDEWKAAANVRRELAGKAELMLRDVLRFGCIRPVTPRIAEALHARSQSGVLLEQLQRHCTERWELWELIERLRGDGLDPIGLWQEPGVDVSERLCRLIPPERFRIYSIASATPSPLGKPAETLELTVGQLRYAAPAALEELAPESSGCPMSNPEQLAQSQLRQGTASSFLARAGRQQTPVPFFIERPARFQLPEDPRTPILFFAGGTGISPFRGFLQERTRTASSGLCWLFWSLRQGHDFSCQEELLPALRSGVLRLDVCFSRESARVEYDSAWGLSLGQGVSRRIDDLIIDPDRAREIWRLLAPTSAGGQGASAYVCGRTGFARSVLDALKRVFSQFALEALPGAEPAPAAEIAAEDEAALEAERERRANGLLHHLIANNRLLLEIHTDAQPEIAEPRWIDSTEVAEHNSEAAGYWMVIDRVVYDLSEFVDLHPGGRRIVQAYAGLDATHGYARAHFQRPEVDAMREMYRLGLLRALEFDDYTAEISGPTGPYRIGCRTAHAAWLQALHLVVEMQNALSADYSLQEGVTTEGEPADARGAYKLSRVAETHYRFLEHYQKVIENETLPNLWRISQGLFAPEASADWMSTALSTLRQQGDVRDMEALALSIFQDFATHAKDPTSLKRMLITFQEADLRLLRELKRALLAGVRAFERHQKRTRLCGAGEIREACRAALQAFEQSALRLAADMRINLQSNASASNAEAQTQPPPTPISRLYASEHWIFEEDPEQCIATLQRTPVPWTSLAQLKHENEAILSGLAPRQQEHGLLVDMRQAPIRNDAEFENAMAKLRLVLTAHFKRTAILLDSNLGELQVTRIERDERRNALATRSESTALKFLIGGK
jgi:sulfite reductase (NADPH) flavoprotein alpha-component